MSLAAASYTAEGTETLSVPGMLAIIEGVVFRMCKVKIRPPPLQFGFDYLEVPFGANPVIGLDLRLVEVQSNTTLPSLAAVSYIRRAWCRPSS